MYIYIYTYWLLRTCIVSEEIIDDLNARRALYEQMLSRARIDAYNNEKTLNKWAAEVSVMAVNCGCNYHS